MFHLFPWLQRQRVLAEARRWQAEQRREYDAARERLAAQARQDPPGHDREAS